MKTIQSRFNVGDQVTLSDSGRENDNYSDLPATMVITHVATKYMPAKEFFANGRPAGYHPGYDDGTGAALYDLKDVGGKPILVSLYDWEIEESEETGK